MYTNIGLVQEVLSGLPSNNLQVNLMVNLSNIGKTIAKRGCALVQAREFWDIINRDDKDFVDFKEKQPTVTFAQDIREYSTGLETGMMASLIYVAEKQEMIHIVCNLTNFEEYNKTFELPVYEGEDGKFVRWSESFCYPQNKIVEFFVEGKNELPFEVGQGSELYKEYVESNSDLTYVKWLESEVLKLRASS